MLKVANVPNIHLYTYSEIENISGFIGNFKVSIKKKARYVTEDCNGCGACVEVCPAYGYDEFNEFMNSRKAIYTYFAQAVPSIAQIDMDRCIQCELCKKACDLNAIDFTQKDTIENVKVGSIIVATGLDVHKGKEYGRGKFENIITQLELERMLAPNGPTIGHLARPSDGKRPKKILFINCAGSRDRNTHTYCSVVCCNLTVKNSKLIKSEYPDTEIVVSFIDMRCAGKDYEEYYTQARDSGIIFLRGHVGNIKEDPKSKDLIVQIEAFTMERFLEMEFDLIVLSSASIPSKHAKEIEKMLGLETSRDGFFKEMHSRLDAINTKIPGICIAGAAQGPKSIPEAITQGRAAAAALSGIMHKDSYEILLVRGYIDNDACSKCGLCQLNCPYNAIMITKNHAEVNEILCRGCGTCLANCPSEAITLKYYRESQYEKQIDSILYEF